MRRHAPRIQHGNVLTKAVSFVPAVGHKKHIAAKLGQKTAQFHLKALTQVAVKSGKRFVEQQKFRLTHKDPRKRRTLLLPAGKCIGTAVFKPFQPEQGNRAAQLFLFAGVVLFTVHPAQNVLPHRHVGEQRIILEQKPDPALLRRQVDMMFGVKKNFAVEFNAAAVRLINARNAVECPAFAAARSPEQTQNPSIGGKVYI